MRKFLRSNYLKFIICVLLLLGNSITLLAQKFHAKANAKEVPQNYTFEVTYTIENGDLDKFTPPKFTNFDAYGPSQSQNMSIVNGHVSRSVSYIYTLQPKKKGTFTIDEATATIDGKPYKCNSITITVIDAQPKPQQQQNAYQDPFEEFFGRPQRQQQKINPEKLAAEGILVRVIPSKTSLYEGDQVTLSYKLYFRLRYDGLNAVKVPSYNGFLAQEFDIPEQDLKEPEIETYNGKKYYAQEFRRVVLFPQKAGKITISPMDFSCIVGIEIPHPYNPFFTTLEPYEYNFSSNEVSLDVLALPQPQPKNFSGAVGKFSFQASYDKTKVKINEPITLKLAYNGTGNLKLISAPKLQFPEEFEAYEPKTNENSSSQGNTVSGTKSFEYTLIPQDGGKFLLPEYEFGYFDLEKKKYITFKLPATEINVEGKAKPSINLINFNKREKQSIKQTSLAQNFTSLQNDVIFYNSNPFWIATSSPLLFLLIAFLFRKKDYTEEQLLFRRRKKAHAIALKRLSVAKKLMQQFKEKEFYDEVIRSLWQYTADKLHIRVIDLSKENIATTLHNRNISTDRITQLQDVLENCEMALFASVNKSEAMQQTYTDAINWIIAIDEELSVKNV